MVHARLGALCGLLAVVGCGGGSGVSSGPLSGKIGGLSWAVATAQTIPGAGTTSTFFVGMYATSFTPCTDAPPGDSVLISDLPMAAGTYPFTSNFTADLWDEATSMNQNATQGSIVVDSLTASTIAGGADVMFDANNHVSGKFQITICH